MLRSLYCKHNHASDQVLSCGSDSEICFITLQLKCPFAILGWHEIAEVI